MSSIVFSQNKGKRLDKFATRSLFGPALRYNEPRRVQHQNLHGSRGVFDVSQVDDLFEQQPALVLDGGLATELEGRGFDLNHALWSARLLISNPNAIREVHRLYLEAGAQCLITSSYQASIPGLIAEGMNEASAKAMLTASVSIARQACEQFLDEHAPVSNRPIVAGSIGPYGAYLADGAEYRGDYGIGASALKDFHGPRLETICQAEPDLLAFETIPSWQEANVLKDLLEEFQATAWISFSCRDGTRISDGTPLAQCARLLQDCRQVFAIGINCTAPHFISSLIGEVREAAPHKRIVVYPNSGQSYDSRRRCWVGPSRADDFAGLVGDWLQGGATLIGGCCQTGPHHIRAIREAVNSHAAVKRASP